MRHRQRMRLPKIRIWWFFIRYFKKWSNKLKSLYILLLWGGCGSDGSAVIQWLVGYLFNCWSLTMINHFLTQSLSLAFIAARVLLFIIIPDICLTCSFSEVPDIHKISNWGFRLCWISSQKERMALSNLFCSIPRIWTQQTHTHMHKEMFDSIFFIVHCRLSAKIHVNLFTKSN